MTFPARTLAECAAIINAPTSLLATHAAPVNGNILNVFQHAPATMRQFWIDVTTKFPDRTYIVYEDSERYTYAEAWALTTRLASVFRDVYGVHKGDRVAIVMRNLSEWLIAYWATYLLGAVPVLVNALLPGKVISFCITHTTCKLILLDGERADRLGAHLSSIRAESGATGIIVAKAHEGKGSWKKNSEIQTWEGILEKHKTIDDKTWVKEPECSPDDNSSIFFTSGTTGMPKGVLSTQRGTTNAIFSNYVGLVRNALRLGATLPLPEPPNQRVALLSIPLFHVTGSCGTVLPCTGVGGKVVLVRKWDPEQAIDLILKEEVTTAGGVPSIVVDLIQAELHKRAAASDKKLYLEQFGYGGAAPPAQLAGHIEKLFGPQVYNAQGYGLTETNAGVVNVFGRDSTTRPLSTGLPIPTTEILIVNPKTRKSVPVGEVGEIWIRGPNVMKGYWKNPEATKKVLTSDGWFNSEDLGSVDEEGFLYIRGRVKDIIIRGGENIDALAVENALYDDERVLACAAVGVPDARLGELPAAFVQPRPGAQVTEAELIDVAKQRLPAFAVPVMVIIFKEGEEFEKNAAGKIPKAGLRATAGKEWKRRTSKTSARL